MTITISFKLKIHLLTKYYQIEENENKKKRRVIVLFYFFFIKLELVLEY